MNKEDMKQVKKEKFSLEELQIESITIDDVSIWVNPKFLCKYKLGDVAND